MSGENNEQSVQNAAVAYLATRAGPSTAAPTNGSRTMVALDSQPREEADDVGSGVESGTDERVLGVLHLRGGPRRRPRVAWTEDVIDNEGMGKKKSKSEFISSLNDVYCF